MNFTINLCLLVLVASSSAWAKKVTFHDCNSQFAMHEVHVTPCGTEDWCPLIRTQQSTISLVFTANKDVAQVGARVFGILEGVPMPFKIKQRDACESSNITCPLVSGQRYHYTQVVDVKNVYPKLPVLVKWVLFEKGKGSAGPLACAIINTKIVDPE